MNFRHFASNATNLTRFNQLSEQQKVDEAAALCRLSAEKFAQIAEHLSEDVRSSIDAYIPNPLFLIEAAFFDKSNLTIPRRRHKYAPVFVSLLEQPNGSLKIHPSFASKYGTTEIPVNTIANKDELLDFLHQQSITSKTEWPVIKTKSGKQIRITHLLKTGQFRIAKNTETTTDAKEGLVTLFYEVLKRKALSASHHFSVTNLAKDLRPLVVFCEQLTGESPQTRTQLKAWILEQISNPTKIACATCQQTFSQAKALHTAYPTARLDRFEIFNQVRALGASITFLSKDKWNPGDAYIVLPNKERQIQQALEIIKMQKGDRAKQLQTLNDLFVHAWGHTNRPLVSISLKLQDAQGGKAKEFITKIAKEHGTHKATYNVTHDDIIKPVSQIQHETMYLRAWLKNACEAFSGDVSISYTGDINSTPQLAKNEKRLREKYACLKLVRFMLEKSGLDRLDQTIVSAIGYALSMSGVNPTFFKITANKKPENPAKLEKFPAGGVIVLSSPGIDVVDTNDNNRIAFKCTITKGESNCTVMLSARGYGKEQVTLEIERISCAPID